VSSAIVIRNGDLETSLRPAKAEWAVSARVEPVAKTETTVRIASLLAGINAIATPAIDMPPSDAIPGVTPGGDSPALEKPARTED